MEPLNAVDVTVLWHGWLKKLGGFSKRWKRRYFVFLSTANGMKELRHYDTQKDVTVLLGSTPKGVISLADATGICCFQPPSPSAVMAKKHTVFNLIDSHDTSAADIHDQKFAILTPLHVHLLAFQSGREWTNASESQQGLSLLATLSAFYSTVDVLHTGMLSKKRERTGHSAAKHSIISYWKRHFFVFLSSGDLLYFRDETLGEFHGRVDVRHAPTVRVTGERMLEEKKKEIGAMLLKLAKKTGAGGDRENFLVWIATPPSKMFVIKLQDDHEGVLADGRRQEPTASAKKWLSLLLQGHAETKYTQLEQCITTEKFDTTAEVISAVRAGIPDELRAAMWKGLSGAPDMQRRAELKRTIRKATKTFSLRSLTSVKEDGGAGRSMSRNLFDEMSGPLDSRSLDEPEGKMIFARLSAIALYEMKMGSLPRVSTSRSHRLTNVDGSIDSSSRRPPFAVASMSLDEDEEDMSDSESSNSPASKHRTLKDTTIGKTGHHIYPSEAPSAAWEISSRRRLLIATSRFNPFSHPCPWKAICLLLAYLEEDSAFWVINSIQDVYLPGYYHGYRPALQVDIAAFCGMLEERAPALFAHLSELSFPVDQTAERWFLSLFTSTYLPLPTVLRVWDVFFAQGVRILFGVGLALFLRAEDMLFRAKSSSEAREILHGAERTSIDADILFSHALKDDLSISWLSEERFDKVRGRYRQRLIDLVATELHVFKDKLSILSQIQDQITRMLTTAKRLQSLTKRSQVHETERSSPLSPFRRGDQWNAVVGDEVEGDDGASPLSASLTALRECSRYAEEAILNAASELNSRQARWLALSSQLNAYPSSRGAVRLSSDLQSWSLQVKEGKVSGAGLDALSDQGLKLVPRLEEHHGMFLDMDDCKIASWLVTHRNDFQPDDHDTTDDFLHALVSTIKAASAVRLECIGSANRSEWHGGRWLQSTVSYPADANGALNGRSRSSSRGLRRSVSNAGNSAFATSVSNSRRNPQSGGVDADHAVTSRSSLDDSVLRRQHGTDILQQRPSISGMAYPMTPVHEDTSINTSGGSRGNTILDGSSIYMDYESTYYSALPTLLHSPTSSSSNGISGAKLFTAWQTQGEDFGAPVQNSRAYQQLSLQYRQSEQTLHTAVDMMMSCFSRFLRIESRHASKPKRELRHRALLLEDDLLQELRVVDAIASSSKELY